MNARFHGPWLLLVHALTPFRLARRGPALHLVLVRTPCPVRTERRRARDCRSRRGAQRRGAGAPRAGRQHQQRHTELRRRSRGRRSCSRPSSTRWASRPAGSTARRSSARVIWSRSGRGRAALSPHRPPRHRVRGRQPVPAVRAPERAPGARPRDHRHEGRRRHHRAGAQGAPAPPARSTACT